MARRTHTPWRYIGRKSDSLPVRIYKRFMRALWKRRII